MIISDSRYDVTASTAGATEGHCGPDRTENHDSRATGRQGSESGAGPAGTRAPGSPAYREQCRRQWLSPAAGELNSDAFKFMPVTEAC